MEHEANGLDGSFPGTFGQGLAPGGSETMVVPPPSVAPGVSQEHEANWLDGSFPGTSGQGLAPAGSERIMVPPSPVTGLASGEHVAVALEGFPGKLGHGPAPSAVCADTTSRPVAVAAVTSAAAAAKICRLPTHLNRSQGPRMLFH